MKSKKHKVFCIGMFRTGTTTMSQCLSRLGYKNRGFMGLLGFDEKSAPREQNPNFPRILNYAKRFDSFDDAPWLFIYREMDRYFPGSKFILTRRSTSEKLAESERNWHLIRGGKEKDVPSTNYFIERYETHNQEVREYFKGRPDDLLEVCWEEGDDWQKVCNFLDEPVPLDKDGETAPIPRANTSNSRRKWFFRAKRLYRWFFPRKSPIS